MKEQQNFLINCKCISQTARFLNEYSTGNVSICHFACTCYLVVVIWKEKLVSKNFYEWNAKMIPVLPAEEVKLYGKTFYALLLDYVKKVQIVYK